MARFGFEDREGDGINLLQFTLAGASLVAGGWVAVGIGGLSIAISIATAP